MLRIIEIKNIDFWFKRFIFPIPSMCLKSIHYHRTRTEKCQIMYPISLLRYLYINGETIVNPRHWKTIIISTVIICHLMENVKNLVHIFNLAHRRETGIQHWKQVLIREIQSYFVGVFVYYYISVVRVY